MLQSLIREMEGVMLRVLAPQSLHHPRFHTTEGCVSSPLGCIHSFLILRHGVIFHLRRIALSANYRTI